MQGIAEPQVRQAHHEPVRYDHSRLLRGHARAHRACLTVYKWAWPDGAHKSAALRHYGVGHRGVDGVPPRKDEGYVGFAATEHRKMVALQRTVVRLSPGGRPQNPSRPRHFFPNPNFQPIRYKKRVRMSTSFFRMRGPGFCHRPYSTIDLSHEFVKALSGYIGRYK